MKRSGCLPALFCLVPVVSGFAAPAPAFKTAEGTPRVPFSFVRNMGQANKDVRYIGNGPEFKAWFRDGGVTLQQGNAVTRVGFDGGNPNPRIEAADATGAKANYIRSSDPGQWQTDLPMFGSLHYKGVWPGIEIRFKSEETRAKVEYVVDPGASVDTIRLRFDGKPEIQTDGSLIVSNESGEFREDKPFLFQDEGAVRTEVHGGFRKWADGSIGFFVADYDGSKPLVVDPTILMSGYFGGSGQSTITGVAINSYYNIVVTGWTVGTDLPASGGAKPHNAGGVDAFVASFSPAGGALVFCTYLGGSGDDRAFGLAVDSANNTYITGQTSSKNFPVVGGVQTKLNSARNAFVAKLNAAGNALVYSTYLGGSGVDMGNAIMLDASNSAIIIGDTTSPNMPVTAGVFQRTLAGGQDAFVAKLNPAGSALTWLTYFGGSAADHCASLKVDPTGAVFIVGSTYSPDFPTVQAYQPQSGGGQDGFVSKLAADGVSLIFSTYIGGSAGSPGAPEEVNAVSFGGAGILLIAGTTSSVDFPTTSTAPQATFGGGQTDGFIARMDPNSGAVQRSTFVGGSGDDGINAMVGDVSNAYYITGYTSSMDFPTVNPVQSSNHGGLDAFVAKLSFAQVIFVSYLGGAGNDSGNAIAIDSLTNIVVAGTTGSASIPILGNVGKTQGSSLTSFVTKFAPNFTLAAISTPTFYFDVWHNTGYNGPVVTLNAASFGVAGDIPLIADWDGTGKKRIGIFRNGTWILDINGNNVMDAGDKTVVFGQVGDIPVLGDWNGTGRIKLGLYRQGTFILDLSGHLSGVATGLSDVTFPFGLTGDIPVVADWNGSGTCKVGVYRSGQWLIDYSGTHTVNKTYTYGLAAATPVVGDWSSSGVANQIGTYLNGLWTLNVNGTNQMSGASANGQFELHLAFGGAGYVPRVF